MMMARMPALGDQNYRETAIAPAAALKKRFDDG
jgi:hypothetical protein